MHGHLYTTVAPVLLSLTSTLTTTTTKNEFFHRQAASFIMSHCHNPPVSTRADCPYGGCHSVCQCVFNPPPVPKDVESDEPQVNRNGDDVDAEPTEGTNHRAIEKNESIEAPEDGTKPETERPTSLPEQPLVLEDPPPPSKTPTAPADNTSATAKAQDQDERPPDVWANAMLRGRKLLLAESKKFYIMTGYTWMPGGLNPPNEGQTDPVRDPGCLVFIPDEAGNWFNFKRRYGFSN